ncbi:MAG: efflux RND transporter periplasmic adaptor subunit [Bythopirellula sp.]|nr:efflux RND transporter periplasmic adaptor subunit [Bythopirellula sp.]
MITEFLVHPGDTVSAGQTLAVVSSPEVGAARAEIKRRETELQLAQRQTDWQTRIREGVSALVEMIRDQKDPGAIDATLQYQTLGEYRERLISAYTRARLADRMSRNIHEAAASGAVSGKVFQERESERQAAEAALKAAIEQSHFEIEQATRESTARSDDARRQLEVSLQNLLSLLGPAAEKLDEASTSAAGRSLSEVNIVAPIDGAVEERTLAVTERVAAGEPIAVIANTSQLWAVADIREQDWSTIDVDVGEDVVITTPALPNESFAGQVLTVGRSVNTTTGAASLIARLPVADRRLLPGLFIRMRIPAGASHSAVMVPESAIAVHEGQSFVFVPEETSQFRRVDVQIGELEGDQVEILAGLSGGTSVVSEGTFFLKSALLMVGAEE